MEVFLICLLVKYKNVNTSVTFSCLILFFLWHTEIIISIFHFVDLDLTKRCLSELHSADWIYFPF